MENLLDLGSLRVGVKAIVIGIQGGRGVVGRLDAMGIRPGVILNKIAGHPFGGPVVVQINNFRIALGFGMARKVSVATWNREGVD